MKFLSLALAASLALAPALMKADDAFAGWTEAQLKTKILQLQKENADLKAKSGSAAAVAAPSAKATADMLLDDFEGAVAKNGNGWWAGCDDNKLGTTLQPQPWAPEKGGAKGSAHSGRIHGNFGSTKAPWPWATLSLAMSNPDISGYSALRFYAKGDGSNVRVQIGKLSVKDFATHEATFKAGPEWTLVTLPLSGFKQPNWGKAVGDTFNDVEKIAFGPIDGDKAYDISIDDVTLVK